MPKKMDIRETFRTTVHSTVNIYDIRNSKINAKSIKDRPTRLY